MCLIRKSRTHDVTLIHLTIRSKEQACSHAAVCIMGGLKCSSIAYVQKVRNVFIQQPKT